MTTRRGFTSELKSRVTHEAMRGGKVTQEIASKHQVHSNQVGTWKRQAMDGLGAVFSSGADRAGRDHASAVRDLHAKIG